MCTRTGWFILGIDSKLMGYFGGKTTPSSAGAAATPPDEGNTRFFFFEVDFNNLLWCFPECRFIPSGFNNLARMFFQSAVSFPC